MKHSSSVLPPLPTSPPSILLLLTKYCHLVSIIANLAKIPAAHTQILKCKALQFLLDLLDVKNPQETNSELEAALERTVSKAAIAIARLCLDSNMASNVVRLGGLDRLVRVTRLEIWHSENISIAIMAA